MVYSSQSYHKRRCFGLVGPQRWKKWKSKNSVDQQAMTRCDTKEGARPLRKQSLLGLRSKFTHSEGHILKPTTSGRKKYEASERNIALKVTADTNQYLWIPCNSKEPPGKMEKEKIRKSTNGVNGHLRHKWKTTSTTEARSYSDHGGSLHIPRDSQRLYKIDNKGKKYEVSEKIVP